MWQAEALALLPLRGLLSTRYAVVLAVRLDADSGTHREAESSREESEGRQIEARLSAAGAEMERATRKFLKLTMRCTAETIPIVDPMAIRRVRLIKREDGLVFDSLEHCMEVTGGTMLAHEVDVEDVGLATTRLDHDDDVVDCSNRVFTVTTEMMLQRCLLGVMIFPSRRWRSHRVGDDITHFPDADSGVLFLGNPIRIHVGQDGLTVVREPTFLIRSGVQMGY